MGCLSPLGDIDTTHTHTHTHTHTWHTHTYIYENLCDQRQRKTYRVMMLGLVNIEVLGLGIVVAIVFGLDLDESA